MHSRTTEPTEVVYRLLEGGERGRCGGEEHAEDFERISPTTSFVFRAAELLTPICVSTAEIGGFYGAKSLSFLTLPNISPTYPVDVNMAVYKPQHQGSNSFCSIKPVSSTIRGCNSA